MEHQFYVPRDSGWGNVQYLLFHLLESTVKQNTETAYHAFIWHQDRPTTLQAAMRHLFSTFSPRTLYEDPWSLHGISWFDFWSNAIHQDHLTATCWAIPFQDSFVWVSIRIIKGESRHKVHHYEERFIFFKGRFSNWSTLHRNALRFHSLVVPFLFMPHCQIENFSYSQYLKGRNFRLLV